MTKNDLFLQKEVAQTLGMPFYAGYSDDDFSDKLIEFINHLIVTDFQKLVYVLYKIDVSEVKLREMLRQNSNETSSQIIAALIVERQIQKIETRKKYNSSTNIPEEEKW
jgi:hypothetical protein